MSDAPIPEYADEKPRWTRRKKALVALEILVLLSLPLAAIGAYFFYLHRVDQALADAVAEADRLDPDWRFEIIEKRRMAIALEENAAVPIRKVMVLTPSGTRYNDPEIAELQDLPPQCRLDPKVAEKLRKELGPFLSTGVEAKKAIPLKKGAHAIAWKPDFISSSVPHVQAVRELGAFLRDLALLQNQDGQHEEAWQSSLAIVAAARSFGEEPTLISQLVRMALQTNAVRSFEQCLALGKASDAMLAEAQQHLTEEAAVPVFRIGARGERAGMHELMIRAEAGQVDMGTIITFGRGKSKAPPFLPQWRGNLKIDHAFLLRHYTDAVEASKLPPHEMRAKLRELDSALKGDIPLVAKNLVAATLRIAEAGMRNRLLMDCAVAAMGCERFRLKNERWPKSLEEVIAAGFLDKVPLDAYDGNPVRFRKTSDGIVIFGLGRDGNYAGDALDPDRTFDPEPTRYEFRLWDENQRRQAPRPRPKSDDG